MNYNQADDNDSPTDGASWIATIQSTKNVPNIRHNGGQMSLTGIKLLQTRRL
jgi:hypothetical protein